MPLGALAHRWAAASVRSTTLRAVRRCLVLSALLIGALLAMAGSAAGAARLYVPSYGGSPESIGGFERTANGSLTPVAGSPFAAYSSPSVVAGILGFAFTPDGGRAATSYLFKGGVQGESIASNGTLAPAGSPVTSASATGLAITPDGRFAYTSTRTFGGVTAEGIRGYSIGADGSLSALPVTASTTEYQDIAITHDGRFLYSIVSGQVARFAIGANGTLTPLGTTAVVGATQLVVSPDGRLLLVGIGGAADGVASYSIAVDGSLTLNGKPALTGDVSMDYFAVAPDGRHVYMPDSNVDAIVTAAIDSDGAPTVIGATPVMNPEAVAASPDGRFLYIHRGGGNLGVASIGTDGIPVVLPFETPWKSGEPERLVFQPQPTPAASFTAIAAPPGVESTFDAGGSARAARFDWDFGDGTTLLDGGPAPRHAFARAGAYRVTLTVTDQQGCSSQQIYTGQSTTCPGGSAATTSLEVNINAPPVIGPGPVIDPRPVISALWVSNRTFSVPPAKGKRATSARLKRGTTFLYELSEAASVRFKVDRKLPGRTVGAKCKPLTARNRTLAHCVRFIKASPPVMAAAKAGANKTPYTGRRRGGKVLPPGRYRATAVATDSAGGRSVPRFVGFTVVPAQP